MNVDTRRDCSLMMSARETYTSRKCVECIVLCTHRCCGHPLLLERFFDALGHLVGFWHPACRVYFPLHPARYEPVATYLGPHSRRTHVPLVRHPPSLDIKANRNAPAIRRHCLAWEHQVTSDSIREAMRELGQRCSNSVDDNGPASRQHCVLAICEMLFVQPGFGSRSQRFERNKKSFFPIHV